MKRTRAELRAEIERLERTGCLVNHQRIRQLKRAVEAIDHEREQEKSRKAKDMAKTREKQAEQQRGKKFNFFGWF